MIFKEAARPTVPPDRTAGLTVTIWGARGTLPVSGKNFEMFGGSTMCIEINCAAQRVIIDAGSGIWQLGQEMKQQAAGNIVVLLTHYHLDHVMGLATFLPLFRQATAVSVHAPVLTGEHPDSILRRLICDPYFPVPMTETGATFGIRGFTPGERIALAGQDIRTIGLQHPGGSCGYRIDSDGSSVAVITDHEHETDQPHPALVQFCAGADLVLYDAHWDEESDYDAHRGWGHSTWQAGLRLMQAAGARRLGCLHHAPDATDHTLLEREALLRQSHPSCFFAREGQTIVV